MMNENDPFKKMDLNFNGENHENDFNKQREQISAQNIQQQNQTNFNNENQRMTLNENQNSFKNDEIEDKHKKLEKESNAKKHRRISYQWIAILLLSIVFGFTSIWNFGQDIANIIDKLSDDNSNFWSNLSAFLSMFLDSFEAVLFIFFIIYSLKRYLINRKPWIDWWVETEPERIRLELKKEINLNNKLRERVNELSIPFLPRTYDGTTEKDKAEFLKEENKDLERAIKKHKKSKKGALQVA